MNKVNIPLLVILDFGLVRGSIRDPIIEMASLLAIVVGTHETMHFSPFTARLLDELVPSSQQAIEVMTFGITLIALMLVAMFLAKVLIKMLKVAELGSLSRLVGALFGTLKAAVIAGSLFVLLEHIFRTEKWLSPSALSESVLYEPVKSIDAVVYADVF